MAASLPLDPARIRAEFPSFRQPELKNFAYFENAGGSFTSADVLNRMRNFYWNNRVQPYEYHGPGRAASKAVEEAYRRFALALNVAADWIHFGPSTSANTYTLARALEAWLRPGEAMIVTNQDHEANTGVWRKLSARGIEIREWAIDPQTGHLDLNDLDKLLDSKVRIVAMPHASNIVAEINPVADAVKKAKAFGAITIVDGVAYAPHGLPDVLALGCDIYLFSAYKVYGPHQGVMAIRPSLAQELPNQGHFFNETVREKRLVPAGPDYAQIAAASGVVDYLEKVADIAGTAVQGAGPFRIAHNAMRQQEMALVTPLLDYLRGKNGVRLVGPDDPAKRTPTISIMTDRPAAHIAGLLARHDLGVGAGHFYSYRLLEALGINPAHGVLRLSLLHYTAPEEIDRLIKALDTEL